MAPAVTAILQRFTPEWTALRQPAAIRAACSEGGYTPWHDRVLTPVTTIRLCRLPPPHGHTACGPLPHSSGGPFPAAAYRHARAK
jgi:hypothetical protein